MYELTGKDAAYLKLLIDQEYYWRTGWQRGERDADEDIKAGRVKQFDNAKNAIEWLEQEND